MEDVLCACGRVSTEQLTELLEVEVEALLRGELRTRPSGIVYGDLRCCPRCRGPIAYCPCPGVEE